MKTRLEIDYAILLQKYKNHEWKNLKQKRIWEINLEVMEELEEKLLKERIRKELYEKYFEDNIE